MNNTEVKPEEVIVDVTYEEYEANLAAGLLEDEILKPGRHTFRRGGFLARHNLGPDEVASTAKVRVWLNLDVDVVDYFKQRAAQPQAAPYETQINDALRNIMNREKEHST